MARTIRKIALISFLSMLTVGCSSGSYSLRETNGNDNYLKTPKLVPLTIPKGLSAPQSDATYVVDSQAKLPGNLGKKVDIRPPIEPLALLDHATANYEKSTASVTFESNKTLASLWSELPNLLTQMGIKVVKTDNATHTLQTAPYTWLKEHQKLGYTATYSIQLTQSGQKFNLIIKLTALTLQNQAVTSKNELQRYTTLLLNKLQQAWLELQPTDMQQSSKGSVSLQASQLQLGKDSNGLASIIIRQPYQTVWKALPSVLQNIGFTLDSVEKTKGTLGVKFLGLSSAQLKQLGVTELTQLTKGDYQLQLGDLTNRTSLQLNDSNGNPVDAAINNDFLNLLKAGLTSINAPNTSKK